MFVALCYLNKSPAFGHDGPICDNVGLKIRLSGVAMFLRKLLTSCQRRATRDEKITTGRHIWGSFASKLLGFLAQLNYKYKSNTRSVLFPPFLWLWNLWRRKVWEGRETQIAREGRGGEEALGKVLPEIGAKPGDVRGDLCPNDTLCVQLQLGKNKLFDTCARPVAKDIFVSCPVLICS